MSIQRYQILSDPAHASKCDTGGWVSYADHTAALSSQEARIKELKAERETFQCAAAEVYQCVGVLLSDADRFDSPDGLMLLDLLSWMSGNRGECPDIDKLLPFASHEIRQALSPEGERK